MFLASARCPSYNYSVKQIYFVRHGESEYNRQDKWAGSSDTPLTPKGRKQAAAAGKQAREQGLVFDVIISSPLSRAHHTAQHIASELEYPHEQIILNPKLVERHFGELEGKRDLVISAKYLLDERAVEPYGAEKLHDLQKRAEAVLQELHHTPHQSILIVSHGSFGRALRRAVNQQSVHSRGDRIKNAEMIRLI
jgi:probable phosphoglycerate mutase